MNKYKVHSIFVLVVLLGGAIIYLFYNPKVFQDIVHADKTWDVFITILGSLIFALIVAFIIKKWSDKTITMVTNATKLAGEDLPKDVLGVLFKPVTGGAYAPNQYINKNDVKKDVVKTSDANLFAVRVTSTITGVSYFQLHDKNTLPNLNDKPCLSFIIPAASIENPYILDIGMNYFAPSKYFLNGISWTISRVQDKYVDLDTEDYYSVNISYF